jgi:hypothetical protein
MPVLSGLRVSAVDGALELVGTTSADDPHRVRPRSKARAAQSFRAPVLEIVPNSAARSASTWLTTARHRGRALRDDTANLERCRVPRLPEIEAAESGSRPLRSQKHCVKWSGGLRDDARPILTVLLTASAGGLRLVSTDSYRLASRPPGRQHAGGGTTSSWRRGLGECAAVVESGREIEVVLGERSRVPRWYTDVDPADRGGSRTPAVDPDGYPNRLTVSRGAAGGGEPGPVGQSKDTAPIRLGMTSEVWSSRRCARRR